MRDEVRVGGSARQEVEASDVVHEAREQRLVGVETRHLARHHVRDGGDLEAVAPDPFRLLVEDLDVLRGAQLLHRDRDGRRAHDVVADAQHCAAHVGDGLAARVHRDRVRDLDQPRAEQRLGAEHAREAVGIDRRVGERGAHAQRRAGERRKRDLLGRQVRRERLQEGIGALGGIGLGAHGGGVAAAAKLPQHGAPRRLYARPRQDGSCSASSTRRAREAQHLERDTHRIAARHEEAHVARLLALVLRRRAEAPLPQHERLAPARRRRPAARARPPRPRGSMRRSFSACAIARRPNAPRRLATSVSARADVGQTKPSAASSSSVAVDVASSSPPRARSRSASSSRPKSRRASRRSGDRLQRRRRTRDVASRADPESARGRAARRPRSTISRLRAASAGAWAR